jgi:hypothetical protein
MRVHTYHIIYAVYILFTWMQDKLFSLKFFA